MDNLSEKLSQLLNDPEGLKQMMDMAVSLGSQLNLSPEKDATAAASEVLQGAGRKEEKQDALVHALLPYLRPARQAKLQRAIQISHLSKLAEAAIIASAKPSQGEPDSHV